MKKRILLFILAIAMPIGSIFAQMSYNHWSVQAKGGVNTIKGLYPANKPWNRTYNAEYGGSVEYTFSPLIGLGAEYLYLNNDHSKQNFTSNVHLATLFASINVTNFTLQFRKGFWKEFNSYLNLGTGFGFGNYSNPTGLVKKGDVMLLAAVFGLNFEYNISPDFAIGLEPQYRWGTNSKFNPSPYQVNEKNFYTINLNVRYKFIGSKMHIRNQNYVVYQLDQISNLEHQQKQESGAVNSKMQELLNQQAQRNAFVKDSLTKDSLRTDSISKSIALDKQNTTDGIYFKKMGQNVGERNITDNQDSLKNVSKPTEVAKTPIIEPIVEGKTGFDTKPVSIRKEVYPTCNALLKQYSVVVGSFSGKENAERLSTKLKNDGYDGIVVQNEDGMYRVISFTSSNIDLAVAKVKKMRAAYPDAWITVCEVK